MYNYALDKFTGTMVGVLSTKPSWNESVDYAKLIESILVLGKTPPLLGELVFVFEVMPDCPQPSALWRQKFGETRKQLQHPMIFILISSSALIRGVATAVNWISPPKQGYAGACANVQEAVATIEKRLKREVPNLSRLYAQAAGTH
jgi:hypothetical protein